MPVFNEERAVEGTVREWLPVLRKHVPQFYLLAIDDGSTDSTPAILSQLASEFPDSLRLMRHSNIGHGQTCLRGYRQAFAIGASWVFQIDSDGQCDPQYFPAVWAQRDRFDVIYGVREVRHDGLRRVFASGILRWSMKIAFRVRCPDTNVPYRLIKTAVLTSYLGTIPPTFVLANVALATLMSRDPEISEGTIPIHFRERAGGEPSVPLWKFGFRAAQLFYQTAQMLSQMRR